jgi:uncharacterized protein
MLTRNVQLKLREALGESPAVALLGPRQVGKTTLAYELVQGGAQYLDLESPEDREKLQNPEQYLRQRQGKLVILDEVQRMPRIFEPLRGLIDQAVRSGYSNRQFLLLGSASLDLLQKTSETLAGRIQFIELSGLHRLELPQEQWEDGWLRGGFPKSTLAKSLQSSIAWRSSFIRTYLERDIPQLAPRVSAELLRRLWMMLAHLQASVINVSQLARNLSLDTRTVSSYIALLTDLLLVRQLQPWHSNVGKRLIKSPKVYVRDSGLVHSLLGISDMDSLLAHPVIGASWEGHVIESLSAVAPTLCQSHFYRTNAGAEIDLLLTFASGEQWAIEIKHSSTPKPRRGFYNACEDIKPAKKWIIGSVAEPYWLENQIEVLPLQEAMLRLQATHL